jgi:hypothetical protein
MNYKDVSPTDVFAKGARGTDALLYLLLKLKII